MTKYLSTFLLITCFYLNLLGQNSEVQPNLSEIRKNNYQVELGFRSFQSIYNNTASATILFKKKYSPGALVDVSSVKFLRAYFTINSAFKITGDSLPRRQLSFDTKNNVDVTLGFGIEKQIQNRNFVHYYGCDLFANYYDGSQLRNYSYTNLLSNYTAFYLYEKSINTGLIPFFGLKYYITDQLNVGVETGFSLSYYRTNAKDIIYTSESNKEQEVITQTNLNQVTESGIKFNFLGLRFFTIGYTFK